jgi:hypothetical protein
MDLFQANDTVPNFLFRNRGDGAFEDVALRAEVAYDASGRALGAMGVDAADVDSDGTLDVFVTNFTNQPNSLFRNDRHGTFTESAAALGLAAASLPLSGFGARFLDFDDDGFLDLFVVNGHPFEPVARVWPGITYAEPPLLFQGTPSGFRDVTAEHGAALRRSFAGRGLAVGDIDNDGDPDLLLMCVGSPPVLLRNDGGNRNHWIGVRLVGQRLNRDAVGARVTVRARGRTWSRSVVGGASYCSASDPRLLFGLGQAARVDRLEVRWPDGQVDTRVDLPANEYVTMRQGSAAEAVGRTR